MVRIFKVREDQGNATIAESLIPQFNEPLHRSKNHNFEKTTVFPALVEPSDFAKL